MKFRILPLGFALALISLHAAPADRVASASSGKNPDPGDLVLFPLDDVSLPWRDNLKVTLQQPVKFPGNPVFRAGPVEGPDGYGPLIYGTVIKEAGKFRMWYLASPRADDRIPGDAEAMVHDFALSPMPRAPMASTGIAPTWAWSNFAATSTTTWSAVEPQTDPYAKFIHDFVAVIRDDADPDASRRYKMAFITRDVPTRSASTGTAASPDGLRWTLANTTMFTKGHFENTSLVEFDGLYYLSGQDVPWHDAGLLDGSPAGRVMKVFFSPDFRHWSNGRALAFYRRDYLPKPTNSGEENHMGAGQWNRGNVILGLNGRWHGHTIIAPPGDENLKDDSLVGLTIDLGLVISNDAIHYREPVPGFIEIPHGAAADWDAYAVLEANAFANTDRETFIWYSNWNTSKSDAVPVASKPLSAAALQKSPAVGLVVLPRDRFGYFSKLLSVSRERNPSANVKRDASCLSRSFRLSQASTLSANVDHVAPGAALQIALVDDAEQPLPGYTADLTQASLKTEVTWSNGSNALPVGKAFRVKATWPAQVDAARLYALYIEHE